MNMRRVLLAIGIIALVLIGLAIRTYPRDISLSIKGVEYKLGSTGSVRPVTLQLNGILQTSLLGKRTLKGTVDILGVTVPNVSKKMPVQLTFGSILGGPISYINSKTQQVNEYGSLYANSKLNEFTITVFKEEANGSSWSGADGLMISAPAQTRTQALQISNDLMKARLLPGHPLE